LEGQAVPDEHQATTIGKRIVVTAFGSLGDLFPFVAIAVALAERGHDVAVATGAIYRQRIESLGLGFHPLRPDSDWLSDPVATAYLMDPRWGAIRIVRFLMGPHLRHSYEDMCAAADDADLLVAHPLCYATRLVAEKRGIAWASTTHTPTGLFSAHDPPYIPGAPGFSRALRLLGPVFWGSFGPFVSRLASTMAAPLHRLRREIGLPVVPETNPLIEGYSPALHLALFSRRLAKLQRDWPTQTVQTGFPFHDHDARTGLAAPLVKFLDEGPPPLVFTLGTSSAAIAGSFFEESVRAAKLVGRRAVLVLNDMRNRPAALPDGMIAVAYAPFAELFPRAAVIVHHGGIGTTGLAMRAGRPALVVPFVYDQPDNAARAARLGIARIIASRRYTAASAARELRRLLDDPSYADRADQVGAEVRAEGGVGAACDALEKLLSRT
jgi:rhamnosyltransferase subunit B